MTTSAEQMTINIRMVDSTLKTLRFEGLSCTTLQLKQKISGEFLIPVEFQKIVDPESRILEHSDLIERDSTELTLVVSLEEVRAGLEEPPATAG